MYNVTLHVVDSSVQRRLHQSQRDVIEMTFNCFARGLSKIIQCELIVVLLRIAGNCSRRARVCVCVGGGST